MTRRGDRSQVRQGLEAAAGVGALGGRGEHARDDGHAAQLRALAGARNEDLNQDRLIAQARDKARRINARSNSTREEEDVAQARVDKLRDDKVVRMKQARLGADDAVNDVAAARIIAIQQLDELRRMLEEAIAPDPAPSPATP